MEEELKKLIGVLNEELKSAKEFLKFSQATTSSLENFKFSGLETSVENSPKVISRLLDLEDQRTQILLGLSQKLGVPCEKLTISELAKLSSPYSTELVALKSKLFPVLKELVKLSRINRYLVSRSLSFIEDKIRVFRSAASPTAETYEAKGITKKAELSIIDKQI